MGRREVEAAAHVAAAGLDAVAYLSATDPADRVVLEYVAARAAQIADAQARAAMESVM